ncbi:TOG array regulator of axonemal microtubules protein 2-like isoform X2 [Limulus polyphemus]|uniref:TOG array regulator of axonemal microtubules protein 2-like isoform X2 n=1 Tax=Limulus polyphemus TaxID=6850 RepID=A0ABM1T0M0_LIMPO|nr:TOG array regulator of axonemal microtubules protein 2-like isoform X2 [Limulus polyphemus]XP_022249426.1 TOG array regulator of axonemal microtubules protein 2-like isoform X2 [Limulus polyphemus]
MKQNSKRDMTVGESSPIPLKPTLARALSARSRHQRPLHQRRCQTDQVLGALWKMAEPQYSVWSSATTENDSEVEEVDALLTPYDKAQSEQNRDSTRINDSNRLPSTSSLGDEDISSDPKQKSFSSITDAVFSGKPVLIRSPSLRWLKQGNRARIENRANREVHSDKTQRIMGNSEPASKPPDGDSFASHKIKVVGTGIVPSTKSLITKPSPLRRRVNAWNIAPSLTPELKNVYTQYKDREFVPTENSRDVKTSPTDEYEDDFEAISSESENNDHLIIPTASVTRNKQFKRQQQVFKEKRRVKERDRQMQKQHLEKKQEDERERHRQKRESSKKREQDEDTSILRRTRIELDNENKSYSNTDNFLLLEATSAIALSPSSKSTSRLRKKISPERVSSSQSLPGKTKKNSPVTSATISERGSIENSGSFSNPCDSLTNALKTITSEDWLQKVNAMNEFNRLAAYQPQLLQAELHSVVLVLLSEIRNLRSSVSRAAINTFGILFQKCPRHMEADLDLITKTLLHKSGENAGFIREDIGKTLKHLVDGVSLQKAALAIVDGGASHRNAAVRGTTAEFLSMTVEKLGPSRCMTGCKDVAEKVISATAQFVMDRSPLARFYGRTIFSMLMEHPDFDRILQKNLSTSTIRHIRNVLDSIKKKGVGKRPEEGISFKSTKSDFSINRSVRAKKLT